MNNKTYLVFDLETTGLDYKTEQIIEVAAILYDDKFNQLDSFHTFVSLEEGRVLSDFIKEYTGITEEDLANKPTEEQAVKAFEQLIGSNTTVVAQYAPFDFSFIAKWGIEPERFICTKSLTVLADGTEVSSSLKPTCERLGIQLDNAHSAMDDTKATAKVLEYRLGQNLTYTENYVVKRPDQVGDMFVPKHIKHLI